MASYNSAMPGTTSRPAAYAAALPMVDPTAPAGTFAPGTRIQVGDHKVVIQKYFSEGGFAHVYLVKMPKPIDGTDIAVLKRVAVPDKENLANMRTEVETMKKLKGHRPIVTYYDSHASQLKGGGYEVFLLMEFCNGGGLIDFMNTRLQNRLTEPEILKIFSDVAEGVACMHYLQPPLLHRDLKVENVLITTSTRGSKRFKLCDFGSTAPPRPAGQTAQECALIADDVQKHTTMQYRSPEMVDVYRKQPIDEKSDIWALGVLLYKLCYYTTPFEAQGQLAILNASFKFPAYPAFSDKLKKLIASMLKEHPKSRPNIYQVLREACLMQGIEVPIKDIYATRTESESRRNQQLPPTDQQFASPPPVVGAVFSPPAPQQTVIPEVVPMRRGRPTAGSSAHAAKPSPSPMRGTASDPFAALDSKSPAGAVDEISSRFPSLDQFSLLHDHGSKFEFDGGSTTSTKTNKLDERVTQKLADDAFAVSAQGRSAASAAGPPGSTVSRAQKIISNNPELQSVSASVAPVYQPTPSRSNMVSTGTMTSPTPPPPGGQQASPYNPYPIHRFPAGSDHHRASSLPRTQDPTIVKQPQRQEDQASLQPHPLPRNSSFEKRPSHIRHISASSRPSLEGGRPGVDAVDPITRTKSSNARTRPTSTYLESNMDFLREKETEKRTSIDKSRKSMDRPRPSLDQSRPPYSKPTETAVGGDSGSEAETNIESNVDFLQTMEAKRRSSSSRKEKRTSLPSMSLSGTKNLLAGKFGDAFKRFENNASAPPAPRTPSPLQELGRKDLTPIAGSEATDGRSDDGNVLDDADDLPPEQRREIERRRLSMEEKRVANAAAEYRKRLADRDAGSTPKSIGGVSRAASIQHKVKSLLDENQNPSPKKTAEGYGRYTNNASPTQASQFERQPHSQNPYMNPSLVRKPLATNNLVHPQSSPVRGDLNYAKPRPHHQISSPALASKTGTARPSAPPKPIHLNSVSTGPRSQFISGSPPKAMPLPSRPAVQARPDMTTQEKEDYITDFSKRFPSLSGIEMVETDIVIDEKGGRSREI